MCPSSEAHLSVYSQEREKPTFLLELRSVSAAALEVSAVEPIENTVTMQLFDQVMLLHELLHQRVAIVDRSLHELHDPLLVEVLQQGLLKPRDVLPDKLGDCKVVDEVQYDLLDSLLGERLILSTGVLAQHKCPYRLCIDVQQELAEGVILHPQYDEQLSIFARHAGVPVGLQHDLGVVQHEPQDRLVAKVAQQEIPDGPLPALSKRIESFPEISEEPMEELLESSSSMGSATNFSTAL